jgi:hypothetical protein
MNITELKEWITNLPEEVNEYPIVVRDIIEEGENFKYSDKPVISIFVDRQSGRICFHEPESHENVKKIQKIQQDKEKESESE